MDLEAMPCKYQCLFGISSMKGELREGLATSTSGDGWSIAVLTGGNNRAYWFLNHTLPKVLYGKDIPRYTTLEQEAMAKKYAKTPIDGKNVFFEDLYKARVRAVLVPLQSYTFEKWHFGRIMTIGDSCHKVLAVSPSN